MKMLSLVAVAMFSLSAFSQTNLDKFFGKIEGKWEMIHAANEERRTDGTIHTTTTTRHLTTVTKAGNGWMVYEDVCIMDTTGEDCQESFTSYEVIGEKFYVITDGNPIHAAILASLPANLNYTYNTPRFLNTVRNSFSGNGNWVQLKLIRSDDGKYYTHSLVSRRL